MAAYLGDFIEDDTLHFIWSTNNTAGASITRATNGTVAVYKDNGTTQSTAGVTDTEDFDGVTGIHACTIDLSADAFYATGSNYSVVLSGATIDGQTVNAVLAHFSIQNRYNDITVTEPAGIFAWPSTLGTIMGWLGAVSRNKLTQTSTTQTVRNDADNADIAASTVSDNGTTFTRGEFA